MSIEKEVRRRVLSVLEAEGSGMGGARGGVLLSGGARGGARAGYLMGGRYCLTRDREGKKGALRCSKWQDGVAPAGWVPAGPEPKRREPKRDCLRRHEPARPGLKGRCAKYAKHDRLADVYGMGRYRGGAPVSASENLRDAAHKLAGRYGVSGRLAEFLADLVARAGKYVGGARSRMGPSMARRLRYYPRGSGVLLSGGARGQSAYISFLKSYMNKHGLSYKEAMMEVRRKKLWQGEGSTY